MRIIVDANIVFSAILNTNSKIADLLLNSKGTFDFLAPDFLQTELRKYHSKISKLSKLSISEIENVENKITKPIVFMSGIHIPENKWILAENMVKDIDNKDTTYVAFSLFYKCKIWSGDKELRNGLENKGFKNVISTKELFEIRETKRKTKR
ncbi:MAG: PIN domain-containing protein [Bacteroidia bacterium]|nr:PIN domain-containing protein [Bacteroidia bacterium]MCX6261676.1 PIN domain-containing protein [Bacteroidia bacterium]